MTLAPSHCVRGSVLSLVLIAAVAVSAGCPAKAPEPAATERPAVSLLAEDAVRLSNDPAKTEVFRDAGLGLFIHWGPNSQVGTETSWPLFNAGNDFVEKYYALASTFDPAGFDPGQWARLAKPPSVERGLGGFVCRW